MPARKMLAAGLMVGSALAVSRAESAAPGVDEALKYSPVQAGIDYDTPTADEADTDDDEVEAFADGPVILAVTHPNYAHDLELSEDTRSELLADLRSGT